MDGLVAAFIPRSDHSEMNDLNLVRFVFTLILCSACKNVIKSGNKDRMVKSNHE